MQMSDVRHLAETLENRLSAVLSLTAGHVFDLKSRTWNDDPQTNIGEGLRHAKTFIICTHLFQHVCWQNTVKSPLLDGCMAIRYPVNPK